MIAEERSATDLLVHVAANVLGELRERLLETGAEGAA